jgi:FAD/FMN-containing dehydrogenase
LGTPEGVAEALRRELDLYEPLRKVIGADWAKDHRARPLAVETTALQGRRATGIWARPDIVSVEVRTFEHVPGKFIEVVTFEVKPADAISVQAVYEALAHRSAATHSGVLLHVPDDRRTELEAAIAEVAEVARAHGIGVLVVADPDNYETWEEREAAERVTPDPERLDTFIGQQLSGSARRRISLALR